VSRDRIEQQKAASFLAAFVGTWSAIGKVYNQATLKKLLEAAVAQSSEAGQAAAQSSEAGQAVAQSSEAEAGRKHNRST
jgi:hypothetical protein